MSVSSTPWMVVVSIGGDIYADRCAPMTKNGEIRGDRGTLVGMKSFNVTMPEDLLAYVRERTKEGGFGTPTEFLRHLIRQDREERVERELEERLLEGLKSPRSRVPAKKLFQRMHALVDEVAAERRRKSRDGKATRSAARG